MRKGRQSQCGDVPRWNCSSASASHGAGMRATSSRFLSARASRSRSRVGISIRARQRTRRNFVRLIPTHKSRQPAEGKRTEHAQVAMVSRSSSTNGLPFCSRSSCSAYRHQRDSSYRRSHSSGDLCWSNSSLRAAVRLFAFCDVEFY